MDAYKGKAFIFAGLLFVGALLYFRFPNDRVVFYVWMVGAAVVCYLILVRPVLHCPSCGRATRYFDDYSEWTDRLRGGWHRYVRCARCGCIIDRLNRLAVGRVSPATRGFLNRLDLLLRIWKWINAAAWTLAIASVALGLIVMHSVMHEMGNPQRARVVLLGCGIAFASALVLMVTGRWVLRRAKRLAEERGIPFSTRTRIRW